MPPKKIKMPPKKIKMPPKKKGICLTGLKCSLRNTCCNCTARTEDNELKNSATCVFPNCIANFTLLSFPALGEHVLSAHGLTGSHCPGCGYWESRPGHLTRHMGTCEVLTGKAHGNRLVELMQKGAQGPLLSQCSRAVS